MPSEGVSDSLRGNLGTQRPARLSPPEVRWLMIAADTSSYSPLYTLSSLFIGIATGITASPSNVSLISACSDLHSIIRGHGFYFSIRANPPSRPFQKVVIVGAGSAGRLLALLLAQHRMPVVVLKAWSGLDSRLRVTQYGTPASRISQDAKRSEANFLDDVRAVSIPDFKGIY